MDSKAPKRIRLDETMDSSHVIEWFAKLSNKGKEDLCRQLFEKCPVTVLNNVGDIVTLMKKRDFITLLPTELSKKILRYLDNSDLVTAQLVCKKWRQAVIDLPLYRIMCEHLDVDKSEYETPDQAIAICNHIVTKQKSLFADWFSQVIYDPGDDIEQVQFVQFSKFNNITYIIVQGMDKSGNGVVHIANSEDIRNSSPVNICRIRTTQTILGLKFLNLESIFCGLIDGTIERWNMRSKLVTTYRQHNDRVWGLNANEEHDLLFSGDVEGGLYGWRISTGEKLCQAFIYQYVRQIQLRLSNDISTPITVAVRSDKGLLIIFSYSEDGWHLNRLYQLQTADWCSIHGVTITTDGFRFLYKENLDWSVMEYMVQTNLVRRQEMNFQGDIINARVTTNGYRFLNKEGSRFVSDSGDWFRVEYLLDAGHVRKEKLRFGYNNTIENALAIGTKYCFLHIDHFDRRFNCLIILKKADSSNDWKPIKNPSPIEFRKSKIFHVLADDDWLNGLRTYNTKGIAFARYVRYDKMDKKIYCFFWK